jgi:hypothetical protein
MTIQVIYAHDNNFDKSLSDANISILKHEN